MASPVQLPTDVCTPRYPIPYWLLYGHTSWCLHASWSYTVLVTAWTLVLVSACSMNPYRAGYGMDTRHGISSPVNHRCLQIPLSHTVLVTARTYVLVSAHPSVPYRSGYWLRGTLYVCESVIALCELCAKFED